MSESTFAASSVPARYRSLNFPQMAVIALGLLFVAVWQAPPHHGYEGLASYLPLHILLEGFSIVVSMLVFGVAWNSYSIERSGNIVILACALLAVGLIDFAHLLSFQGMPDFVTPANPEKAITFWLAARLIAAAAFLVAAMRGSQPLRSPRTRYVLLVGSLVLVALAYWIGLFHQEDLPHTFVEGKGLTPIKVGAEYVIVGMLAIPTLLFYVRARRKRSFEASLLFAAAAISILGELCFTLYSGVTDVFNLLGHVCKAVAYAFIYRAVFAASVREPFERLLQAKNRIQSEELELRKATEQIADLYNKAPCGYHSLDRDGVFVQINDTELAWLGYTREEMIGRMNFAELLTPDSRSLFQDNYPGFKERGSVRDLEFEMLRRDGSVLPVLLSASAVTASDGSYLMSRSMIYDITERRRAENAIRTSNRALRVSSSCNQALIRVSEEQELFEEICRIIVEEGGYRLAWFGLVERDAAKTIRPVAQRGYEAGYLDRLRLTWADTDRGKGPSGEAVRTACTQVNQDFATNPLMAPWRDDALQRGYHSSIALPLKGESEVIGVLAICAAEPDAFDADEVKLLEELANNFAFGIAVLRARVAHARAQIALRDSEEKFRNISSSAQDAVILMDDAGKVAFWNEAARQMYGYSEQEILGRDLHRTLVPERHREAYEPGLRKFFATGGGAFLGKREELIGRRKDGAEFPVEMLVSAMQINGKWHAAAMVRDITERKAQELKIARLSRIQAVLSGINALIVRVQDRKQLFDGACQIAVEHGSFGMAWISLWDPATALITPVACAGADAQYFRGRSPVPAPQGASLACDEVGRAIHEKRPVFDNQLSAKPGAGSECWQEAAGLGYRSGIAFPLLVEGAVTAILTLYAKEPDFFNPDELKLLSELAGDISFALDHLAKKERVDYLAYYDVLTGLPNRALFADRVDQNLQQSKQSGKMSALMLLDVERFRNISDTLGRQGSDTILKLITQRLSEAVGAQASLARVGADVFGIAVGAVEGVSDIAHFVEKQINACFSRGFRADGHELRVAARLGVAVSPADGSDADTLYKNAERALLKAKEAQEQYLFYAADMNARVAESLNIENRLRKAVDEQQFILHYQPKIESKTGVVVGLEALIRWNDPETGMVPPGKFISILEETGLILPVGAWAMKEAVNCYKRWSGQGLKPPHIAVNVSAIQLRRKDFVSSVQEAIRSASNGDHGLDLEITESLIMTNVEDNIAKLRAIKHMGIQIAIDDFGTGYSSLQYLSQLPVDSLKIDRSFVVRMPESGAQMSIVSTIIALAHDLELKVVAEGVETEEQAKLLRLLKCNEMQGYLFSRPVPEGQIPDLLRQSEAGIAAGRSG